MLPTPATIQSIGKQLMAARLERGLEVEDVTFKTHISAARIRDLENDDLSNFASPAYARGFLKIYSNFLNLDLRDYLSEFSTNDYANVSGHDYIQSANAGIASLNRTAPAPRRESVRLGIWIILLVLTVLTAIPVLYWNRPAEPVPTPGPAVAIAPKARVVEPAGTTDHSLSASSNSANASTPQREVEIKSATPASIRARVIPEDPVDAPAPPRNDVTNPPSPDDAPPAALKSPNTTGAVQIRKALSEFAGDPPPNP